MRNHITACAVLLIGALLVAASCWADVSSDLSRGNELYDAGDYAEAAGLFQKVITSDPGLATKALYGLGMCQVQQNMLDDAMSSFNSGLHNLASSDDEALRCQLKEGLALAYIRAGMLDEASQLATQLVGSELSKDFGFILQSYVQRYVGDHGRDAAVEAYLKLLDSFQDPSRLSTGTLTLIDEVLLAGSRDDARKLASLLSDRMATKPALLAHGGVRSSMACLLSKAGRVDDAVAIAKGGVQASDSPERQASWHFQAANILFNHGRCSMAAATAQRLVDDSASPDRVRASAKYLMAMCHLRTRNQQAAIGHLNEIVALYPSLPCAEQARRDLRSIVPAAATVSH